MKDLSSKDVDKAIKDISLPEDTLYFELGIAVVYRKKQNILYSYDYVSEGKRFYEYLSGKLFSYFCDSATLKPKNSIIELMEGDEKELAVGVVSYILSKYSVEINIIVPFTSILLKKGLYNFCKNPVNAHQEIIIYDWLKSKQESDNK